MQMKLTNPDELNELLDEQSYAAHCKESEE